MAQLFAIVLGPPKPGADSLLNHRSLKLGKHVTLAADESSGGVNMTLTPKQPPAPSPVSVENSDQSICVEKTLAKFRKRRSIKSGVCAN
jgi:hypothetical protein